MFILTPAFMIAAMGLCVFTLLCSEHKEQFPTTLTKGKAMALSLS